MLAGADFWWSRTHTVTSPSAHNAGSPRISVVMPTYDQDAFLPAAVSSLLSQTLEDWELVIVDDGSPGDARAALGHLLDDPRIRLLKLPENTGLGHALNQGLDATSAPYVAYLPSDDLYFRDHLASLHAALQAQSPGVLACAGIRSRGVASVPGRDVVEAPGRIPGEPMQLVQVMHRRTEDRWIERNELTTDDLDRMLWNRLLAGAAPVETGEVTCEWVRHPRQRHLALREPAGGLNTYRSRYRVKQPLRLQSTIGVSHDEVEQYRADRERPDTPVAQDGLRILLVGELAHNPERVLALEERGHKLYGLWTKDPYWFNYVGPLPFGHVEDLPPDNWEDALERLRPDVIYGLLNYQAIPLADRVLSRARALGIPFVWHLKEGPFFSRKAGTWPELVRLHTRSNGQIYSSEELRDWFGAVLPATRALPSLVLDGDLPRRPRQEGRRSALLSDTDGEPHTLIAGRPMGPDPEFVGRLAAHGVHVHLYGEKVQMQMRDWVQACQRLAPDHLHLHPQVPPSRWVEEFSRYDAGWLHDFRSANGGDILAAIWDDLNVPARVATLATAGVPFIQRDNSDSAVATDSLARRQDLSVFFSGPEDLAEQLKDRQRMGHLRESVWSQRELFTFDAHVDRLVEFLRSAIAIAGADPGTG